MASSQFDFSFQIENSKCNRVKTDWEIKQQISELNRLL